MSAWQLGWLLGLMLACGVATAATTAALEGRVERVTDGDSVWLAPAAGPPVEVRLLGIDAPEGCQAWGPEARRALEELALRRDAQLKTQGKDTHGRTLGTLFVDGKSDLTIRGAGANLTALCIEAEPESPAIWVGGVEPVSRVTLADLTLVSDVSPEGATLAGEIGAIMGTVDTLVLQDVAFAALDGTLHGAIEGRVEITFD